MVKTSTIPPELQAEIVRLRLQEDMGPAAIVAYGKRLGWRTTKGTAVGRHHVNTILYPRGSTAANGPSLPKATVVSPVGSPGGTRPSVAQETAENGDVGTELLVPGLELLAIEERRALPGYVDDEGVPIRPQGARLKLFKAARVVYEVALQDYQKARASGFDRCKACGTTRDSLTRRVGQGLRMADGILVSAEGSEERAARVQITQLNFHLAGQTGPGDPEAPEASSEPVLNADLVRLLSEFLTQHDLAIEGFFTFVQQERQQA